MNGKIEHLTNKATELEITEHLFACDPEFVRVLKERVDITEYGKKIFNKAERFEAWAGDVLVGIVAVYSNDQIRRTAYITSVSMLGNWQGKGIAAQLISRCIEHTKGLGMESISLEVACDNAPAIGLYKKYGFVVTDTGVSTTTMILSFRYGEKHAK